MSEEILINVTPEETRVALVENGMLQEIFIERSEQHDTVGSLYQGKVLRVLPGMQAAFVDIGARRSAFLHVSDMREARAIGAVDGEPLIPIERLLREGQTLLVQVVKDSLGGKGARLSTKISIPSRYLVYMPDSAHVGVSARIEDEGERARLKQVVTALRTDDLPGGYIVRTAGEGASTESLRRDMLMLAKIWQVIAEKAASTPGGRRIHDDLPLVLRTLRDLVDADVERVRIDSPETFKRVSQFVDAFLPDADVRLEQYTADRPIFDLFGVEDEIQRALDRRVPLKSGGYLVIDQTESMTTIDVNTGGYVGHRTLEETIFKTNIEAVQAIARQLRLRNLGGIIIIDFIDMEDEDHRRQVLRALEKCLERDPARTKLSGVSALGLVEMTRKRTRESLGRLLCEPCAVCGGRGYTKSVDTICFEILREIIRAARQFDARELLVLAADNVVTRLLEDKATNLAELEQSLGRPIRLQAQSMYYTDQYDVVML
ncbi:MAG: ribonuclease G [Pseudomonadota bacterium]|nr:ribonuclease G [Pseudomonadota bacterium]HJO35044.1 ribonuclease G [Gammaproteobacteria bacterium]